MENTENKLIIEIGHFADIQVKVRDENLEKSYENNLNNIAEEIRNRKLHVVVLPGDLFEFDDANDVERKLIYNFLGKILAIETVLEVVVMSGNHDLPKTRKEIESNRGSNAIDTFSSFIQSLDINKEKLMYLKDRKIYDSNYFGKYLQYVAYSLEDTKQIIFDAESEKYQISLYHDILIEYVEDSKLPVSKKVMERLLGMNNFQTPLILAGDIHEYYNKEKDGKQFFYPGSTHQRNFGEGTYIIIRGVKSQFKPAAKKMILNHRIDLKGKSHLSVEQILLKDYTSYITIDMNTTNVVENHLEIMKEYLQQTAYGLNFTFIKLVLSTAYINFEAGIRNLISEIYSTCDTVVSIDIKYDKVISKTTEINNIVGAEMLQKALDVVITNSAGEESEINSIEDINESNLGEIFENIILTKDALIELFEKQLQNNRISLLRELGDETLLNEVFDDVRSLFVEQLEMSLNSVPNYNIELLSAETNGFMSLGSNKINLDIPGLIRILATNGVGKTALFNMIRWFVDNKVFESLKDNQKVANDLMVFNDENSEKDDVIVRLNMRINGTLVKGTRYVSRKWKDKVTIEQKSNIGWQKHIASTTRGLQIEIFKEGIDPETNEEFLPKKFTGDEAELFLDRWFGDVINNITIFNQFKILSILNLKSDELNQLVLNYIGVDYLTHMENNIPQIKLRYDSPKPKQTKVQIIDDINVAKLSLKNLEKSSTKLELDKQDSDAEVKNKKDIVDVNQNKLMDLGNIPEDIKNLETNIKDTKKSIDEFVVQELKDLPVFTEIKPVKPELESFETAIKTKETLIETKEKSISENDVEIDKLVLELKTKTEDNVKKLNAYVAEEILKTIGTYEVTLKSQNSDKDKFLLDISTNYDTEKQGIVTKINTETNNRNIQINTKNTNLESIATWNTEIENGVCESCSRAYDEKQHTELCESNKQKIENLEKINLGITAEIDRIKLLLDDYEIEKTKVQNKIDRFILKNYVDLSEDQQKTITKFDLDISETTKSINSLKSGNLKNIHEVLKTQIWLDISDKLIKFDTVLDNIKLKEYDKLNKQNITDLLNSNTELNSQIETEKANIKKLETHIKTTNETYQQNLESFSSKQTKHNEEFTTISDHNAGVNAHNKEIDSFKNSLILYQGQLNEKQSKLDEYNLISKELEAEKLLLETAETKNKEIAENISKDKVSKTRLDADLENANRLFEAYLKYQKDAACFSIYKKIIEKDFRDSVFGYYRNFLNITFNLLLNEMNFKLIWHETGDLYYYKVKKGREFYRPVQSVSGMETCFLGLALLYAIHTLNVKFSISHIFIDEISGQLNSGKELTEKTDIINYQEQLLLLLSKFKDKKIFIVDHVIQNMFQTATYNVRPTDEGSKYELSID